MTQHARGPFEVRLAPQKADNVQAEGSGHGRMSIDKHFHGDLEASSQGEMLSFMTSTKGSAGYVAIEKVAGALGGRKGTFVLQHSGTMDRGAQQLSIAVVPDSGTDELTGLSGSMTIIITTDGKHSYEMEYTFAS
ncbi:MAG: DUF3224 domain-containing protein [Polyangiaceae bacterium]|jgi:hypothetical protein